jgi:glycosyltransferase involved in cell wall biosynthesis
MGKANGLDFLIEVAGELKSHPGIHFVLIGDGSERNRLSQKIKDLDIRNIQILGSVPKTKLPNYLAATDVAAVVFAEYPILEHNSANKFFDALSAGKPVLLNYSGWQKQLLDKYNAGFGINQGDIKSFSLNLMKVYNDRELATRMGENARALALSQFSRNTSAEKVLQVIKSVYKK